MTRFSFLLSYLLCIQPLISGPPDDATIQECLLLSTLMQTVPPEQQQELREKVLVLQQKQLPAEQLCAHLRTLRLELAAYQKRIPTPLIDTGIYTESYSLDKVWQALFYCGIGCALFLIITAIQDMDASKLLSNDQKNGFNKIKKKHQTIRDATIITMEMVRTLTNPQERA